MTAADGDSMIVKGIGLIFKDTLVLGSSQAGSHELDGVGEQRG